MNIYLTVSGSVFSLFLCLIICWSSRMVVFCFATILLPLSSKVAVLGLFANISGEFHLFVYR